jgi:hypothetical protein
MTKISRHGGGERSRTGEAAGAVVCVVSLFRPDRGRKTGNREPSKAFSPGGPTRFLPGALSPLTADAIRLREEARPRGEPEFCLEGKYDDEDPTPQAPFQPGA